MKPNVLNGENQSLLAYLHNILTFKKTSKGQYIVRVPAYSGNLGITFGNCGISIFLYDDENSNYYLYENTRDININEIFNSIFNRNLVNSGLKWNRATLTVFSNRDYEDNFYWDNETYLYDISGGFWSSIHYIGNELFINYLDNNYEGWQSAIFKIIIKDNILRVENNVVIADKNVSFNFEFSEEAQQGCINIYKQANEGELKPLFKPWNTILFNLIYRKDFDDEKDTEFIFDKNA